LCQTSAPRRAGRYLDGDADLEIEIEVCGRRIELPFLSSLYFAVYVLICCAKNNNNVKLSLEIFQIS
jgi:hypothetical protein